MNLYSENTFFILTGVFADVGFIAKSADIIQLTYMKTNYPFSCSLDIGLCARLWLGSSWPAYPMGLGTNTTGSIASLSVYCWPLFV